MPRRKIKKDFSGKYTLPFANYNHWPRADGPAKNLQSAPSVECIIAVSKIEKKHKIKPGKLVEHFLELDRFIASMTSGLSQMPKDSEKRDLLKETITASQNLSAAIFSLDIKSRIILNDLLRTEALRNEDFFHRFKYQIKYIYDCLITKDIITNKTEQIDALRMPLNILLNCLSRSCGQIMSEINNSRIKSSVGAAKEFLIDLLWGKSTPVNQIKKYALEAGIKPSSLERAKKALGIKSIKQSMSGGWDWALPSAQVMREQRFSKPKLKISEDDQLPNLTYLETLELRLNIFIERCENVISVYQDKDGRPFNALGEHIIMRLLWIYETEIAIGATIYPSKYDKINGGRGYDGTFYIFLKDLLDLTKKFLLPEYIPVPSPRSAARVLKPYRTLMSKSRKTQAKI